MKFDLDEVKARREEQVELCIEGKLNYRWKLDRVYCALLPVKPAVKVSCPYLSKADYKVPITIDSEDKRCFECNKLPNIPIDDVTSAGYNPSVLVGIYTSKENTTA